MNKKISDAQKNCPNPNAYKNCPQSRSKLLLRHFSSLLKELYTISYVIGDSKHPNNWGTCEPHLHIFFDKGNYQ